jgi:hypothetical protein
MSALCVTLFRWKNDEIVRCVLRHWSGFQKFYGTLLSHLRATDRKHDLAAASSLEDIRFLIDKVITFIDSYLCLGSIDLM